LVVQTTKWSAQGQTGNLTLGIGSRPRPFNRLWGAKGDPDLEEVMSTLVGFGTFAALLEEQIGEKVRRRILSGDQGMIVWWSIGAGVHVEPHSHPNEQIVWMLKGKMEFRLGTEQRVCGQGDVVVIPGGAEHEAWFREDTEVIDFFVPPRDDFLLGGKPAYMREA
jgi:unsaturated pyranuronate lyase